METKINTLFRLRKSKEKDENKLAIYLRVTIDGKRFEWSTQRNIEEAKWSKSTEKVKGNSEEARAINQYLDVLKHKVFVYQKELMLAESDLTIDAFRDKWLGISSNKKTILEIFRDHNDKLNELVGAEYAVGKYKRYVTAYDHTQRFIKSRYKAADLDISKLNYEFITEFEFWLKKVRKCGHNSTMKYLASFKKVVLICVKNGWLQRDPFFGYKMRSKEVHRDCLTENELDLMKKRNLFPND